MKAYGARALEFAAIAAVLGLAGWRISLDQGDLPRALAVAAAAAALLGVVAAEWAGRAEPPAAARAPPAALLREAMDRVLSGVGGYLEDNLVFRADLEVIDASLAAAPDAARAREAISALRAANRRMETRSGRLRQELETARREIAELRETVDEVERLALLDALTQVGNRRFFDQNLRTDVASCRASGADLCLALADIDRFQAVNDKFGHGVGDHLLKSFAEIFTSGMRGRGKTARYGGDEFALLFPGMAFPEARRIVDALRREIEAKAWAVGGTGRPLGPVTVSIGLAKLAPGEGAENFVRRADSRLMRAKALGGNRVVADDGTAPAAAAAQRARG